MFKNAKAVIFDMDGTLIDSMWVWKEVDIKYLEDKGFTVPPDLKDSIEHMSYDNVARFFQKRFNIEDSIEKIIDDWNNMAYYQYKNNVPLKKGVLNFIKKLKMNGYKIGLATSNCRLLVDTALKANNIESYFDNITLTEEVNAEKDKPDVYLLCAERLGVAPEKCIVFEDILPAINGAKKAGMKVIGVYDDYNLDQKDDICLKSDLFIEDFTEVLDAV